MSAERPPIDEFITFLHTTDLAATATFYEDVLRLPLVLDQGTCRIYRVTGGAFVGFCAALTHTQPNPEARGVILTLVSQDVESWCARIEQRGIPLEQPPMHNPRFNITHAFLRDPNGYLVEIQRFDDPHWADEKGS